MSWRPAWATWHLTFKRREANRERQRLDLSYFDFGSFRLQLSLIPGGMLALGKELRLWRICLNQKLGWRKEKEPESLETSVKYWSRRRHLVQGEAGEAWAQVSLLFPSAQVATTNVCLALLCTQRHSERYQRNKVWWEFPVIFRKVVLPDSGKEALSCIYRQHFKPRRQLRNRMHLRASDGLNGYCHSVFALAVALGSFLLPESLQKNTWLGKDFERFLHNPAKKNFPKPMQSTYFRKFLQKTEAALELTKNVLGIFLLQPFPYWDHSCVPPSSNRNFPECPRLEVLYFLFHF